MNIEEKFLAAMDVVHSIPLDGTFEPSCEMILRLQVYELQATKGPCDEPKPYIWNQSERLKWNAWNELGDMPKQKAMELYILELTKIVETMSYTDKISKFMNLMGPFYEVVSFDEAESTTKIQDQSFPDRILSASVLENYPPSTIMELYHYSKKQVEKENSCPRPTIPDSRAVENKMYSSSSSDSSIFDMLSDLSDNESSPTDTDDLPAFQSCNSQKKCKGTCEEDLLALTLINLQSSLDDIVKKFDKLNVLARISKLTECNNSKENSQEEGWSLAGAALVVLWPIAVEMCFGVET